MTALGVSADEYKSAAEELATLGLITLHSDVNHASGIARACLSPRAFLATAAHFLSDVDVRRERDALLAALREVPVEKNRVRVSDLLKQKLMPLPRLDLILRGLEDLGFLVGHGPAHQEWGSNLDIEVTPLGRRMLRGDEPIPY
jgi:hypothetical protein